LPSYLINTQVVIWSALSGDPQRMGEALLAAVHT
jgi:hypothetical protein